jgi:hypothetical protein
MATRKNDPWTSHEAGASVRNEPDKIEAVLRLLKTEMNDETLVEEYGFLMDNGYVPNASPSGLRTLRKKLTLAGLVIKSDTISLTRSGRKSLVWKRA